MKKFVQRCLLVILLHCCVETASRKIIAKVMPEITNNKNSASSGDSKKDISDAQTNNTINKSGFSSHSSKPTSDRLADDYEVVEPTAFELIEEASRDFAVDNPGLIKEMDIRIPKSTSKSGHGQADAAISFKNRLWTGGVIPYTIDRNLIRVSEKRSADSDKPYNNYPEEIQKAINNWEMQTCIRFVKRTTEEDYAEFSYGHGCSSDVGRSGGKQLISLGEGCNHESVITHEIGHLIGFWHEQNRPDRDDYVTVYEENIKDLFKDAFQKFKKYRIDSMNVPYDYYSIMHFSTRAASKNKLPTILPREKGVMQLGSSVLSNLDLKQANLLYECEKISNLTWTSWSAWSGCTVACEGGAQHRTRVCVAYKNGTPQCPGNAQEERVCNEQACPSWPRFPEDFSFENSYSRQKTNKECLIIYERKDPEAWRGYSFCNKGERKIGMKYSDKGELPNMDCTRLLEPLEDHRNSWYDNYLCMPTNAPYRLRWSFNGPIAGQSCLQWLAKKGLDGWNDNYLCSVGETFDKSSDTNTDPNEVGKKVDESSDTDTNKTAFEMITEASSEFAEANKGLIKEMDIRIPKSTSKSGHGQADAAISFKNRLWPGGVIPYTIDRNLIRVSEKRSANSGKPYKNYPEEIQKAINNWEMQTCIRFVKRTTEEDYVEFSYGLGCSSDVGRSGGKQLISLGGGCNHESVITHEIGHLIGFWHEQNRPDRDDFVTVYEDNIKDLFKDAFQKFKKYRIDSMNVPYDYYSIMHFSTRAASKNKLPTILPREKGVMQLGSSVLSNLDLKQANLLYECEKISNLTWTSWSAWSGCTVACEGGAQHRTRVCVAYKNGTPQCPGNAQEERVCNEQACPSWPRFPEDFSFENSYSRQKTNKECLIIYERKDPEAWRGYSFCNKGERKIGMKYSDKGELPNMDCTRLLEPLEDHRNSWYDNYLCMPTNAPYRLRWSFNGPIAGQSCLQWLAKKGLDGWNDNYLCSVGETFDKSSDTNTDPNEVGKKVDESSDTDTNKTAFEMITEASSEFAEANKGLIKEMDIRIPKSTSKSGHGQADAAISFKNRLWPGGVIPYTIDRNLIRVSEKRSANSGKPYKNYPEEIQKAINNWEMQTCIRFVKRTTEEDYVEFSYGLGCSSDVGRSGGKQLISLGGGCNHESVITHEIGHLIGFWHEQNRPDRDDFVTVYEDNIKDLFKDAFQKFRQYRIDSMSVPYDYYSIMHYSTRAWSKNKLPTILPREKGVMRLGSSVLSNLDLKQANLLYKCEKIMNKTWTNWMPWSECTKTCDGGTQHRARVCTSFKNNVRQCPGSAQEKRVCNQHTCPSWPKFPDDFSFKQFRTHADYSQECLVIYERKDYQAWSGYSLCNRGERKIHMKYSDKGKLPNMRCTQIFEPKEDHRNSWYDNYLCMPTKAPYKLKWSYNGPIAGRPCLQWFAKKGLDGWNDNYLCSVDDTQEKSKQPAVHGGWSDWSTWTKCDKKCGGGKKLRLRMCNNPTPKNGGRKCPGMPADQMSCNTHKCPSCSSVLKDEKGEFFSPNYPAEYPNNANCTWVIVANKGKQIVVEFTDFDFEQVIKDEPCAFDYVEVRDKNSQGKLLGKFCGNKKPVALTSLGNHMWLNMVTDSRDNKAGFHATWHSIDEQKNGCGGMIKALHGKIISPGYPRHYPANELCEWRIEAPLGYFIQMKFVYFHLEKHSKCRYDSVTIVDGWEETSPRVGKYCGYNTVRGVLRTRTNKMTVRFKSDGSTQYKGFNLSWRAAMGTPSTTHDKSDKTCPDNWLFWEPEDETSAPKQGACYTVIESYHTWYEASRQCKKLNALMLSVESQAEQKFVTRELQKANYMWLGLSDSKTEGSWKWSNSSLPLSYTNWDSGDPNNGGASQNEDCALMKPNGMWNDYPCTDRFNYICKKMPKTPVVLAKS